jgi:hypothetical protein
LARRVAAVVRCRERAERERERERDGGELERTKLKAGQNLRNFEKQEDNQSGKGREKESGIEKGKKVKRAKTQAA